MPLARAPETLDAVWLEVEAAAGGDVRLDRAVVDLRKELTDLESVEARARRLERLALVFQGSLLVRHAAGAVADAFCASRFAGGGGRAFGTLTSGVDGHAIVDRARPAS